MTAPRTNQSAARIASLTRRFWSRVDKNGPVAREGLTPCWLWTGPRERKGYGSVTLDGVKGAHRIALMLATGVDWPELCALHSCDNPPCCNPDHLRWGTNADNQADKMARRRHAFGVKQHDAKLTEDDVRAIRAALSAGVRQCDLARQYGVTDVLIYYIRTRRIWRHVPDEKGAA